MVDDLTRLQSELEQARRERDEARKEAERLFCLLDDIDIAEDMFKPDITPHFTYIHKKHRARLDGPISTDGYDLYWQAIKTGEGK